MTFQQDSVMKKCIVCYKEINENSEDACETCSEFFKWKHGENSKKRLSPFIEMKRSKKGKIKFVRRLK